MFGEKQTNILNIYNIQKYKKGKNMKFQNVYDNNEFFKSYIDMRGTDVSPNSLVEVPIIFSLIPDVKGKDILDLGCGYGKISKLFVENGAKSVMALDISQNMIDLANKQNGDKKIEYQVMAMENIGIKSLILSIVLLLFIMLKILICYLRIFIHY